MLSLNIIILLFYNITNNIMLFSHMKICRVVAFIAVTHLQFSLKTNGIYNIFYYEGVAR